MQHDRKKKSKLMESFQQQRNSIVYTLPNRNVNNRTGHVHPTYLPRKHLF